MRIFKVIASNGKVAARFQTYAAANEFVFLNGGTIQEIFKHSTKRQQEAVKWAESICLKYGENAYFKGNINSFDDCSAYLNLWLDLAKELDYQEREQLENSWILDIDYYE